MNIVRGLFSFTSKSIRWFLRTSVKIKILVIVLIVIIGWLLFHNLFATKSTQQQYQTAQVTRGTLLSTVTESGNVASSSQAGVGSPTTGVISAMYVKDGDQVSAGENLFRVKSTATPQEVASAYANYLSAQNNVNSAQAKMNSLQATLFQANQAFVNDKGVGNPTDQQKADPKYIEENATWLQAEADYKNQAGVIVQAQAALNSASLAYDATQDSVVTAPIDGTVANINYEIGDTVSASSGNLSSELNSSSSSNASPILSIGNFTAPYIKVQASEVDIPNIHIGQTATVTLDAFSGQTFVGTVKQVDTVGTNSSGVITYNVFVDLISPPKTIMPGMSATVTIQTNRKDNALYVPSSAIQTQNGQTYARVLQNGQLQLVPVTTGITSDTDTEIVTGLSEGQTVVTSIFTPSSTSTSGTSPFSGGLRGVGGGNAGFGGGGGGRTVIRAGG